MASGLDRTDRVILIFAAVILVVLATGTALVQNSRQRGRTGYPSTYSTQWDGAKAAYLLLEQLGYRVERWNQPPTELAEKSENQILILANPTHQPTPEEKEALQHFLERGGKILATGEVVSLFLPEPQPFVEDDELPSVAFAAVLPSPISSGAPEITMPPPYGWRPSNVDQIVVYGNRDTAAVITYSVGKGQVIWWGSPSPLTNKGIRDPGNLALFLNSLGGPGKVILWDEYFHGARGDLFSYLAETPLPWVLVQSALILILILFTFSRRYGTIRMPGKVSRLSPLEFVDTLGSLYKSAHAGSAAVRVAYQRFRYQFTRQVGLMSNASPAEMALAASNSLGWDQTVVNGALLRADRATRSIELADTEALEIVQELHDYTVRLHTRRSLDGKRLSE